MFVPCPTCGPRPGRGMKWSSDRLTAGWIVEEWFCGDGCQQCFTIERNTITNEFRHQPKIQPESER